MILVVDDEPDNAEIVRQILEQPETEILTAHGCDEALELISMREPRLVVTDISMPGRSGLDLIETLRETGVLKRVPVIIMSALGRSADVEAGLDAGALAYLTKPFAPREIIDLVSTILDSQRPTIAPSRPTRTSPTPYTRIRSI